jgi:hypothetical protein
MEEYKIEVAKKVKNDLKVALQDESRGGTEDDKETKCNRINVEDKVLIKMDKLVDLVQLLVVLSLIMTVLVLLGVVVLICK